MNALKNKVQLIGRLGNDPELKEFSGGKCLVRFSVATTESYKDSNGNWKNDVQWHRCIAWGGKAKLVEKLATKGDEVALEGKLVNQSYEDKEGLKRFNTEIVVNEFLLMSNRGAEARSA